MKKTGRTLLVVLVFLVVMAPYVAGSVPEPSLHLADAPGSLYLPLVPNDSRGPFDLPTVQFSLERYDVREDAGQAAIAVMLSAASQAAVTVDYTMSDGTATAGSDYVATSGTLSFAPGETSQVIAVDLIDDSLYEGEESVSLALTFASQALLGERRTATLAIADDDGAPPTVQFGSASYSAYEGTGTATIVVTLSAASANVVTVDYATSDGTAVAGSDYVAASGSVSLAPGETSYAITVTLLDDGLSETDETLYLALSNPSLAVLGSPSQATLTIVDSDESPTVQFGSATYSAHEGSGTALMVVTLSAAAQNTVTVEFATQDGSATSGQDYVASSGTLSFAPGQVQKTFDIVVNDDLASEGDETVQVVLSQASGADLGAPSSATLTIVDDDLGPGESYFGLQIGAIHEVTPESAMSWDAETSDVRAAAYDSLVTALRDSGAYYARVYLEWDQIQPDQPVPGQEPNYRWWVYDDRFRLLRDAGVELVVIVADAPWWAADQQCAPFYPDRLDDFAQFLTALVERYGAAPYNVRTWELLNEPDWNGTGSMAAGGLACWGNDADRYAEMLSVAYPAIKAVDPGATVLMGGLAHENFEAEDNPNWRFVRYFPDEVLQHGGGEYIDALNIHAFPYYEYEWQQWSPANPPTCGVVDDGVGAAYEAWGIDIIAKVTHFTNRMSVCHQVDLPLWVTETGRGGTETWERSLILQARYAIQGNVRAVAAGAEAVIWFALSTRYSEWQDGGLLFDDWTPKPAFYAYQTLTSELQGYTFARNMNLDSPNEAYVFQNTTGQEKTVAWTTDWGVQTLTFGAASQLRVVDHEGQVTYIQDGGAGDADGSVDGSVRIRLSFDPVFVTVAS